MVQAIHCLGELLLKQNETRKNKQNNKEEEKEEERQNRILMIYCRIVQGNVRLRSIQCCGMLDTTLGAGGVFGEFSMLNNDISVLTAMAEGHILLPLPLLPSLLPFPPLLYIYFVHLSIYLFLFYSF